MKSYPAKFKSSQRKMVQMGASQNSIEILIILWPVYPIHTNSLISVIFEELPFSSCKYFYSWQRLSNLVDLLFECLIISNNWKTTILFPSPLTFLQLPMHHARRLTSPTGFRGKARLLAIFNVQCTSGHYK